MRFLPFPSPDVLLRLALTPLLLMSQPVSAAPTITPLSPHGNFTESHKPALVPDGVSTVSRIPLVLIHGVNPRKKDAYSWKGFLAEASRSPGFYQRYRPVLFVYEPGKPVRENAALLALALRRYRQAHPGTPRFRFVALSLGGLVLRDTLADGELWVQTDRIISLGVPYHGTPLANPDWMRQHLKTHRYFHPVRRGASLAYRITRKKFPHFSEDFRWDNFDGSLPRTEDDKKRCGMPARKPDSYRDKYRLYAGFFGDAPSIKPNSRMKRFNLFSRHALLRMVRPCLSALPTVPPALTPLFTRNDGVSPVSSQLWLDCPHEPSTSGMHLRTVTSFGLNDTKNMRLFEGIDHRDWLENTTRYRDRSPRLRDRLHPEQAGRSIYEWILLDLAD